MNEFAFVYLLI